MPGADTMFVGRGEALRALEAAWQRACEGDSVIVWVDGDSGIGKTTLVRRATAGIDPDRVVYVDTDPDESGRAFDLVDRLITRSGGTPPSDPAERDPGPLLLETITGSDDPRCVIVDDLQWADPESLLALRFALRRIESDGLLVILAGSVDTPLRLGDAWRHLLDDPTRVVRVHLEGIDTTDAATLVHSRPGPALDRAAVERLRTHTGGNPLHLLAMLDELDPAVLAAPDVALPAPRSFLDITRARLDALDPAAHALVRAGAVLGATFRPADAATVASVKDPGAAVDAAIDADLCAVAAAGSISFTHPLIRSAVLDLLDGPERRALHDAASGITTGVTALLHRAEAVDRGDDELAEAIEAAAVDETLDDSARRADLLLVAARVAGTLSLADRLTLCATEALIAGSHLARANMLRDRVAACPPSAHRALVLALLDARTGRFDAARDGFDTAADLARRTVPSGAAGPGDVRARALGGAAFIRWFQGDVDTTLDLAEEALAGDVGWGASLVCHVRAMSLVHLGRFDDAIARPIPEPPPPRLSRVDAYAIRGIIGLYLDDLDRAVADLEAAVGSGGSSHSDQLFAMALAVLAEVELRRGRWDAATRAVDAAVAFAEGIAGVHAQIQALAVSVEIAAARGEWDTARAQLTDADTLAHVAPAWGARTRVAMARAALALAEDDPTALADAAGTLTGGDLETPLARFPTWRWRAIVAEAHLARDDLDGAEATVAELAEIIAHRPVPRVPVGASATLAHLRAEIARRRGDPTVALGHYASLTTGDPAPSPLPIARALLAHGTLLAELGHTDEAIIRLTEARGVCDALGADAYRARCVVALDACGVATPVEPELLAGLTKRQRAVARLVAEGATNREVAAELFVSAKTVEYHLAQIYTKLDLHSRRELAALLRPRRSRN